MQRSQHSWHDVYLSHSMSVVRFLLKVQHTAHGEDRMHVGDISVDDRLCFIGMLHATHRPRQLLHLPTLAQCVAQRHLQLLGCFRHP